MNDDLHTVVVDGSSAIASYTVGDRFIMWANLVLLSLSKHRDANRVLGIGSSTPLGIVLGPRIVGGSLAFTSFDRDAWEDGMEALGLTSAFAQADMMIPFDINVSIPITISGAQSIRQTQDSYNFQIQSHRYQIADTEGVTWTHMQLEGVRLLDEAIVLGADKVTLDQQYSFICTRASRLLSSTSTAFRNVFEQTDNGDAQATLRMLGYDNTVGAKAKAVSSAGYTRSGSEYYMKNQNT